MTGRTSECGLPLWFATGCGTKTSPRARRVSSGRLLWGAISWIWRYMYIPPHLSIVYPNYFSIELSCLNLMQAKDFEAMGITRMFRLRLRQAIEELRNPNLDEWQKPLNVAPQNTSVLALLMVKRTTSQWKKVRTRRHDKRETLRQKAKDSGHDVENDPEFEGM